MAAVLGAGSWGTSLAALLAGNGEPVKLWARNPNVVDYVNRERHNPRYVQHLELPENLTAVNTLKEALDGETLVVHAIPSKATREAAKDYAPYLDADAVIVSATKSLERGTHLRMSEVIHHETGRRCAAISGPNHAEEVSKGQPTAAVLAHPDYEMAKDLASHFNTFYFKTYPRRDLVGTEVCGAYKNVVALAGGMVHGLGWGDNCLACLVTLGIDEMIQLTHLLGGDERSCYGLGGVGDLVATATSTNSRNMRYGRELAKGKTPDQIYHDLNGMVAEGVHATKAFFEYGEAEGLDLPLTRVIHAIVYEGLTVPEGVKKLLKLVEPQELVKFPTPGERAAGKTPTA